MNNSNDRLSTWFTSYGAALEGKARIFALPYSGAGASAYYPWSKKTRDMDFLGVQLPGRENRFNEELITHLPTLLNNIITEIKPLINKPYVLFGHSMGGLIAFELAKLIREQALPLPEHLYISAFRAPNMPNFNRAMHNLSDEDFVSELSTYGGLPSEIISNTELLDFFLPILRADFLLTEFYEYKESQPLSIPITTFSGKNDCIVKSGNMSDWRYQTNKSFRHIEYDGDHFFVNNHMESIINEFRSSFL